MSSEPVALKPDDVVYREYQDESQLPEIVKLIIADLSEPYTIYTYRYFLHDWPQYCLTALSPSGKIIGVVICRDYHKSSLIKRGYIAMLAVDKDHRRLHIGSQLVKRVIQKMKDADCAEVMLETEITNTVALRFYHKLGFVNEKRLLKYYLNGVDAFRLKLWLKEYVVPNNL